MRFIHADIPEKIIKIAPVVGSSANQPGNGLSLVRKKIPRTINMTPKKDCRLPF
jgi:hypothetical protein